MKNRNLVFLLLVLLGLALVPLGNLATRPFRSDQRFFQIDHLFNMDAVSGWVNAALLPLGISSQPEQVVIGDKGWLFLSDHYNNTLSAGRHPTSQQELETIASIAPSVARWDAHFRASGVQAFQIMIAPNKSTIYPEFLPAWARPQLPDTLGAFARFMPSDRSLDLKPLFLLHKQRDPLPLYYRTDSHWNPAGAAVAFEALLRQLAAQQLPLKHPEAQALQVLRTSPRAGGDLARILHLQQHLNDVEPRLGLPAPTRALQWKAYPSGQTIKVRANPSVWTFPVHMQNERALNQKKVLWLTDSFGPAMTGLMSHTFSDVLYVHWDYSSGFLGLVEQWKPDLILVGVVERNATEALQRMFSASPPQTGTPPTPP